MGGPRASGEAVVGAAGVGPGLGPASSGVGKPSSDGKILGETCFVRVSSTQNPWHWAFYGSWFRFRTVIVHYVSARRMR